MTKFLVSCILFVFCVIESQASYEQLKVGYGNLYEESVDLDVELVRGEVPTWLEGLWIMIFVFVIPSIVHFLNYKI